MKTLPDLFKETLRFYSTGPLTVHFLNGDAM